MPMPMPRRPAEMQRCKKRVRSQSRHRSRSLSRRKLSSCLTTGEHALACESTIWAGRSATCLPTVLIAPHISSMVPLSGSRRVHPQRCRLMRRRYKASLPLHPNAPPTLPKSVDACTIRTHARTHARTHGTHPDLSARHSPASPGTTAITHFSTFSACTMKMIAAMPSSYAW